MITDFLRKHNIQITQGGKNVGKKGWINIQCPFCPDHSNHLGLSPTGGFHCWSCGKKGKLTEIVRQFEKCSWGEAKKIAAGLSGFDLKAESPKTEWPKNLLDEPLTIHKKYIKSRGLDINRLIRKYNIKFTGNIGIDRFSIFAPMVGSYALADCTRNRINYIKPENAGTTLYNIERVKTDHVFLVEGLVDCWNFDSDRSDTVAALGIKITPAQIRLLSKFETVIILFDPEAVENSIDVAWQIGGLVKNIVVHDYGNWKGDPGEMDKNKIIEIRKEYGL